MAAYWTRAAARMADQDDAESTSQLLRWSYFVVHYGKVQSVLPSFLLMRFPTVATAVVGWNMFDCNTVNCCMRFVSSADSLSLLMSHGHPPW